MQLLNFITNKPDPNCCEDVETVSPCIKWRIWHGKPQLKLRPRKRLECLVDTSLARASSIRPLSRRIRRSKSGKGTRSRIWSLSEIPSGGNLEFLGNLLFHYQRTEILLKVHFALPANRIALPTTVYL